VFARQTQPITAHAWLIEHPDGVTPPFEGNIVVIEQSDGLVVVDAGGAPASGEAAVAEIRKLSKKPVKALVITHWHGDHNLGAGAFRAAWPRLKIISTVWTRQNMTGPPMDYVPGDAKATADMGALAEKQAQNDKLAPAVHDAWVRIATRAPAMVAGYTGMKVYPADVTFTDRYDIPDRTAPVEVRFLGRGNTDGDAVIWAPKQRVLAAGDLVVAPTPYASQTYPAEWIATLKKLEGFDFAYLVPGHGPVMRDRAYVEKMIAALQTVRDQVGPLAKAGVPLDDVRKRVDVAAMTRSFAGDDPWLAYILNVFFTRDLIATVWKEAHGQAEVQGQS
jgi:glyoxylase-like metal-dependent hydrolase (beta-lactamase superfamily II)